MSIVRVSLIQCWASSELSKHFFQGWDIPHSRLCAQGSLLLTGLLGILCDARIRLVSANSRSPGSPL